MLRNVTLKDCTVSLTSDDFSDSTTEQSQAHIIMVHKTTLQTFWHVSNPPSTKLELSLWASPIFVWINGSSKNCYCYYLLSLMMSMKRVSCCYLSSASKSLIRSIWFETAEVLVAFVNSNGKCCLACWLSIRWGLRRL